MVTLPCADRAWLGSGEPQSHEGPLVTLRVFVVTSLSWVSGGRQGDRPQAAQRLSLQLFPLE